MVFKIVFLGFHSPSLFFPTRFDSYSFNCYFFYCDKFFKLIFFSISSFNIKLAGNWAYWLSMGWGFHELRIWKINSDLGVSPEFAWLFFPIFNFFSFIHWYLFNWRLDFVNFYFLSIWIFTGFENDQGFSYRIYKWYYYKIPIHPMVVFLVFCNKPQQSSDLE
jgi:hypothetical protein